MWFDKLTTNGLHLPIALPLWMPACAAMTTVGRSLPPVWFDKLTTNGLHLPIPPLDARVCSHER